MIPYLQTKFQAYNKVFALILMMALGVMLPQLHALSFLIQYLLMFMLFYAFWGIEIKSDFFHKGLIWLLLTNLAVAFVSYWILYRLNMTLALAAFVTGIAPTAIASPVVVSFINGHVPYVIGSVLLTNIVSALVVPFALPYIVGTVVEISILQVLQPVLIVMFVPLILTRLAILLPQNVRGVIGKGKAMSFPAWLVNLLIISAKAAEFLRSEAVNSTSMVISIAFISLVICVVNFSLGALLGGRRYWQESSQALGQKNNSFVIWIALTFINPLVAMGPTFYILYHNLYNSWQIYRFQKQQKDRGL